MEKPKFAYIIKVDGTRVDLDHRPTLEEAQEIVGGWISLVGVGSGRTLVVDEEGKPKGKITNLKATRMYRKYMPDVGGLIVGDVIVLEGWRTVG